MRRAVSRRSGGMGACGSSAPPRLAGLPRVRFYDLRHTAAMLMLLERIPAKGVSEVLGHGTIAITRKFLRPRVA